MPLLYGEGPKTFRRLQEEIIKASDDHSILAFDTNPSDGTLFAHHPSAFAKVKGRSIHPNYGRRLTLPFSMTNAGLAITTPLIQTLSPYWVLAVLNCVEVDATSNMVRSQICLPLVGKDNQYMRARIPISLISRDLDDPVAQIAFVRNATGKERYTSGVFDLTSSSERSYYISYFGRVYSAYGRQIDVAMRGFEVYPQPEYGLMITFPRGVAGYQLHTALPRGDLRDDISFFIPTCRFVRPSSNPFIGDCQISSGIIIFKDDSLPHDEPSQCVRIYLAFATSTAYTPAILPLRRTFWDGDEDPLRWSCGVSPIREFDNRTDAEEVLARANQDVFQNHSPRYYQYENTIMSARTRFQTPRGEPCRDTVMVEIVFDADELVRERDAEERYFE